MIPVLELESDPTVLPRVVTLARQALDTDGSDVIVLGCAGMAAFCAEVSEQAGVPVIDGVTAATLLVQSLITLGVRMSGRGEYACPPPKRYAGALTAFGAM